VSELRTLFATVLATGFLFAGIVVPAQADNSIVSTFVGSYAPEDKLAGYTTSPSVLPGEALKLRVRSTGAWTAKIVRIGSYAGGDGRVLDSVGTQVAVTQPDCTTTADTFMVSCPWNDTLTFATGAWPTGLYVARLESADGYAVAPFVVRSANAAGTTFF
jgi:hypothetical protein